MTKARLLALNYPRPGGELYLCLPFAPDEVPPDWPRDATGKLVPLQGEEKRHAPYGTPYVTTWLQISEVVWQQ